MAQNNTPKIDRDSAANVPLPRRNLTRGRKVSESDNYQKILESIIESIERYSLCDVKTDQVIVALSGGKDSLLLARALQDLGVDVRPVTVDMGYEQGWADKIIALARPLGIAPEVVDARRPLGGSTVSIQIGRRMEILDSIAPSGISGETPCTHCYNVKVIALEAVAHRDRISRVAFGHHMTDAIASLIKEGLMQVDRWDDENAKFSRRNFELLIERLVNESADFSDKPIPKSLTSRISDLVHTGKLDTDEPPRQPLRGNGKQVEIIRPLFLIDEQKIKNAVIDLNLMTADSGCGHGAAKNTQTPREMVHFRLLEGLQNQAYYSMLRGLVLHGIQSNGSAQVQARKRRSEVLGAHYKTITDYLDKI